MTHGNISFICKFIPNDVMMDSKNVLYGVPASSYITLDSTGRSSQFTSN